MSNKASLADFVKKYRNERKLTREELSNFSGVSQKSIENIESGENTNPKIETFFRLMITLCMPNPTKIPKSVDWEHLPLLAESFSMLLTFDPQSILLFNQMLPDFHSIIQKVKENK